MKAAIASAVTPTPQSVPIDVTQGLTNLAVPTLGGQAIIVPTPLGYGVNPNPVTLATVSQLWGFRRDQWKRFAAGFAGTTETNGSWFQSVTTASGSPCAFHFNFSGRAIEVLFAGTNVQAVVISNGRYATPQFVSRTLVGGVQGAALHAYDTYTRFDFGTAAARRISLYCLSSLGPSAIGIDAADTIGPWDRSSEPAMVAQADSYGAASSVDWATNAIFFEAAVRLGIANVDVDAVGGTGYGLNPGNLRFADSFLGRLPATSARPADLFITAGGINDNNWLALAPYGSGEAARIGFENAVRNYFTQLRAALPEAVLVALGPWQPNASFYPQSASDKADTIRAALSSVAAPWIFVDNLRGGWVASSGASGSGQAWQTGTGNVANPRGDGNGDLYVSGDGTHPSAAGSAWLGTQLAASLKAAIATM